MTPVSKKIGPFTLSLTDQGEGVFQASVALNATAGGGDAAGFATFGGSIFANLNAAQVLELGFDEFNKILPAAVLPLAEVGEAAAETEVKSI